MYIQFSQDHSQPTCRPIRIFCRLNHSMKLRETTKIVTFLTVSLLVVCTNLKFEPCLSFAFQAAKLVPSIKMRISTWMLLLLVAVVFAEDVLGKTISNEREGGEIQSDDKGKSKGKGKGKDKGKSSKENEKSGKDKGKPEKEIILNGFIGKSPPPPFTSTQLNQYKPGYISSNQMPSICRIDQSECTSRPSWFCLSQFNLPL